MTLHVPVLKDEVINSLNIKSGDIVVDATLGGGGHSREILKKIKGKGILIATDADPDVINNFAEFPVSNFKFPNKFQIPIFKFENIYLVNDNFSNLEKILEAIGINKADGIIADLGWSSDQLSGKGISFQKNEPLDMRLSGKGDLTALRVVNEYSQDDLKKILREYGEEKCARNIAKKIIEYRKRKKIETTGELAEIVRGSIPEKYRHGKINPATRTFQAIRIEVNQELENLKKFIPEAIKVLSPGGRLVVISFHSLEDRIIKNIFRENAGGCIYPPVSPCQSAPSNKALLAGEALQMDSLEKIKFIYGFQGRPRIKIITKKPIVPKKIEIEKNLRARSAKLRVCEKI